MRAFKILPVLAFIVLAFSYQSCDKVDEPYLVAVDTLGNGGEPDTTDVRKVLLEEYTGHTCINCPGAAEEIHNLQNIYGEQLIVISVHSGVFASPVNEPFTYDFRTPEGNTLHDFYEVQSYPSGVVNRVQSQGSTVIGEDKWAAAIDESLDLPQQATISISNEFNNENRLLTCDLDIEFLEDLTGTYFLSVYIIESGIIKAQASKDSIIHQYEHNHVLRASMNGVWGDPVGETGEIVTGGVYHSHYTYALDTSWVAKNCEVVGIVYDGDSQTRAVVQAEIAGVIE